MKNSYGISKTSEADIAAMIARVRANMHGKLSNNSASRASIKETSDIAVSDQKNLDQGAHLLSIISREKLLNTCAPDGADNACGEVGFIADQWGEKGHACASLTHASYIEEPVNSLHSSTEEDEFFKETDDTPDHDDAAHLTYDFYEIKTDLFDNSKREKKSTTHRAKLHIRAEPTTSSKDADIFMLDFYNRSREINRRLKEMEVDNDDWYLRFKAEFARYEAMLVFFDIAPKLAILKEIDREDGSSAIIGYAAGIMFQIRNQPATVILYYGASKFELALDFEFNRTPGSAIFKKGIYRDESRGHLDVDREAPKKKFKVKTQRDFS